MNPAWVSAVSAIAVMLTTSAMLIWRAGRHEGRLEAILEHLAEIADDHEERIRDQEAITGIARPDHYSRPRPGAGRRGSSRRLGPP